jgi:nucleoside-diphosphate-sugar epimerase
LSVLVTGGTGNLGRELVPRLVATGYDVVVLSRKDRPAIPNGARAVKGDLTTGEGLDAALTGVDTIVHAASGAGDPRGLTYKSLKKSDVEATQRLVDAAKGAGTQHVLYTSIVGIDKIPSCITA